MPLWEDKIREQTFFRPVRHHPPRFIRLGV